MWTQSIPVMRVDGHQAKKNTEILIKDAEVSLIESGVCIQVLRSISSQLKPLVLGYLVMMDRISTLDDVVSLTQDGDQVLFSLSGTPCSFQPQGLSCSKRLKADAVFQITDKIQERAFLFKDTSITVSAALIQDTELVYFSEDISKENAVYKLLGLQLQEPKEVTILFVSDKITPFEVQAGLRLGCPFILSRLAPTAQAVALAESFGICILGFVRRGKFTIYSHADYCAV